MIINIKNFLKSKNISFYFSKENCIHHNILNKYGIISLKNRSTNIKRILKQNNFEKNKDFKLYVKKSTSSVCK